MSTPSPDGWHHFPVYRTESAAPNTWHPVPNIDHPALSVTVRDRPTPDGHILVRFHRRSRVSCQLDQIAAWLPGGGWDEHRWHPIGARLVPPPVVAIVEAWLRGR